MECRLKDLSSSHGPVTLLFSDITVISVKRSGAEGMWGHPGLKRCGQEGVADWCGDHWWLQRVWQPRSNPTCSQRPLKFKCMCVCYQNNFLLFLYPTRIKHVTTTFLIRLSHSLSFRLSRWEEMETFPSREQLPASRPSTTHVYSTSSVQKEGTSSYMPIYIFIYIYTCRDMWDVRLHRETLIGGDQLSHWLTVSRIPLLSTVHSEGGQEK